MLTISCNASLLYGIIHSFGEYPTALAALSTAKHKSASAPPSLKKLFILSYEKNNKMRRKDTQQIAGLQRLKYPSTGCTTLFYHLIIHEQYELQLRRAMTPSLPAVRFHLFRRPRITP